MQRPRLPAGKAVRTDCEIASRALPESFSGFKIAHFSDPHSYPAKGISEIIRGAAPDITVITGDLLQDETKKPPTRLTELVRELLKISPVYFVSGNHDLWRTDGKEIFAALSDMGAVCMDGKSVEIWRKNEKITLFGIQDPYVKNPDKISEALKKEAGKLEPADGYKILLFHRANLYDEVKDLGYDLILSGHMHGGQVRIPHFGGVLPPSSALGSGKRIFFPDYTAGVVNGKSTMVINRGVGNTLPIPRWGNPPEVGIITLKHIVK